MKKKFVFLLMFVSSLFLSACSIDDIQEIYEIYEAVVPEIEKEELPQELREIYDVKEGQAYIEVNGNIPYLEKEDPSLIEAYEETGSLDWLGRTTSAVAVLGEDLYTYSERPNISSIHPSGWNQKFYTNIPNGALYNRSHLIARKFTYNDTPENLMTGTQYFNQVVMVQIENYVEKYMKETGHHVKYRVTPVYEGNNLLASAIYMEAYSIEDAGEGLQFNLYIPNRQPGIAINYADGSSYGPIGPLEEDQQPEEWEF